MSGVTPLVDTLLATRLAQRVDLIPIKAQSEIAGPGAATPVGRVENDIRLPSREALQQQLGVGLLGRGHASPPVRTPEAVTLSATARAVSAILEVPAGTAPPIRGLEPLCPPLQPPLAPLLTAAMARTVVNSGLFYESHLQQYAAGTRTLGELAQEPQVRLDALATNVVLDSTEAGLATLTAATQLVSGAAADLPRRTHAADISAQPSGTPGSTEQQPLQDALTASRSAASFPATYSQSGVFDAEPATHSLDGLQSSADGPAASATETGGHGERVVLPVHPDAIALVRQQLDLLAVPVFRWSGEAWSGVPMDWEIREEDHPSSGSDKEVVQQTTWTTRMSLVLPTLGPVDVRLNLAGATLQVHLAARDDSTVAVLGDAGLELRQCFDALGLPLTGLQIGSQAAKPGDHDIWGDEHAG